MNTNHKSLNNSKFKGYSSILLEIFINSPLPHSRFIVHVSEAREHYLYVLALEQPLNNNRSFLPLKSRDSPNILLVSVDDVFSGDGFQGDLSC